MNTEQPRLLEVSPIPRHTEYTVPVRAHQRRITQPPIAKARSTDPATSQEAARTVDAAHIERMIRLALATHGDCTADELCDYLRTLHGPSVKTAICRSGAVDSGERRPSRTGRASIVWTTP